MICETVRLLRWNISDQIVRFCQFWQYDPKATDQFKFLDLLLTFGGFHCKLSEKWPRRLWYLSIALTIFQYAVTLLKTVVVLRSSTDYLKVVWYPSLVTVMTASWIIKGFLRRNRGQLDELRQFINARAIHSGDPDFDAMARGKFYRAMQMILAGIFAVMFVNQGLFLVPNPHRDRLFGLPDLVYAYNPIVVSIIQFAFFTTFIIIWGLKYCISPAAVFPLLLGMRAELQIVGRSYERILQEVQANVYVDLKKDGPQNPSLGGQPSTSLEPPPVDQRSVTLFWKHLKDQIITVVDQHNEVLSNLDLLKQIAMKLFVINYYLALTAMASTIFVIMDEKISFCSMVIASGNMSLLLHIFVWCYLVKFLQDGSDSIETSIYDLCFALEYHEGHRSDYKQELTGLLIAALGTRHSVEFSCFQLFQISNELFLDLVNASYSFLTFIIDMRKLAERHQMKT